MVELLISSRRRIAAGLSLLAAVLTSAAHGVQLNIAPAAGYERVVAKVAAIPRERFDRVRVLTGAPEIALNVQIISESEARERRVPPWVSGYAVSEAMTIVLIPPRTVTYPNDGIEDLVVHEVAHLLIDAAAGGGAVPRWFHEGVAMYAATGWDLEDTTRLTFAMWSSVPSSVGAVDRAFHEPGSVTGAYALSGALVRYLVQRHGESLIAAVLDQVRSGADFASAFERAADEPLERAVLDFWRIQTRWRRIAPLLSSSVVVWLGVTFLAVIAIRRRRQLDAERKLLLEEEDQQNGLE